jgi:hypothetical protein
MRRTTTATIAVALACAAPVLAMAAGPGHPRGKEPLRAHPPMHASLKLLYHGGPVMRHNTTYAIYWVPPGRTIAATYRRSIDRYLRDVAAAHGAQNNVYGTLTQYGDATGAIANESAFAGSTVDTSPFPPALCKPYSGVTACLTDGQVRSEVASVIAAHRWHADASTLFILLTPKGVGGCETRSTMSCAFTAWCAYHSNVGTGPGATVYTFVPYGETDPNGCGIPEHPVGYEADATINTLSHEHRESIGDPFGDAWTDSNGAESSDKCAWSFGRAIGSTRTGRYTNLINGHGYMLQMEWSNRSRSCVQRGQ